MNPLSQSLQAESQPVGQESNAVRMGGAVQGFDILKELAEIERELAEKLQEARRSAEGRVTMAEEEARRILADADSRIRQMEETLEARMTQEKEKHARELQTKAEAEAQRIRQQADPKIDQAVEFLLSEVMP